jgi:osmotically-inducible protein OsmY
MQPLTSTAKAAERIRKSRKPCSGSCGLQDISVRTKDGVVVLTGVVHTIEEKMADGQAAKSVYGARGVANYIAVRP